MQEPMGYSVTAVKRGSFINQGSTPTVTSNLKIENNEANLAIKWVRNVVISNIPYISAFLTGFHKGVSGVPTDENA